MKPQMTQIAADKNANAIQSHLRSSAPSAVKIVNRKS
jgi:hypothetical protein